MGVLAPARTLPDGAAHIKVGLQEQAHTAVLTAGQESYGRG